VYEISGNRFLHGMVRSLVGAMVNLAAEQQDNNVLNLTLTGFQDTLLGKRSNRITFTAPPHGLYLVTVGYQVEG
jgi:tRNA U38,U39,U40 pseudouridine synthase TruA